MLVNFVIKNRFYDSVLLMQIANSIKSDFAFEKVSVMMGTEPNLDLMRETGVLLDTTSVTPNDVVVAFDGANQDSFDEAFNALSESLEKRDVSFEKGAEVSCHSVSSAISQMPSSNIAFISLPGPFVRYEAQKALNAGLNVMIFSDNVSLEDEIALKRSAKEKGLLLMGPDCGTAIIKGKALGFANIVSSGNVGIAGASGTGTQELTILLDQKGIGISHAIGTGGRDLSKDVGGITMLTAIDALAKDEETKVVIVISKPPHPEVAKNVVAAVKATKKPAVICFMNGDSGNKDEENLLFAVTIEEAVNKAEFLLTGKQTPLKPFDCELSEMVKRSVELSSVLKEEQKYVRGLYSGGTICEESIVILKGILGDVWSNTSVYPELKIGDAKTSKGHTLVDMGDDEFTRGMPHPMIDFTLRKDRIRKELADPGTAVLLLDVVLGYGSNENPAGEIAGVIKEERAKGRNFIAVAHICGTEDDPQNYSRQQRILESAGIIVFPSNAQAARFAGLAVTRGKAELK